MAIKCEVCGNSMYYNIGKKILCCEKCENTLPVEAVKIHSNIRKAEGSGNAPQKIMEASLFQCPKCGAEIRSFNEEANIRCMYCNNPMFLKETCQARRPDTILPFMIDKNGAKRKFKEHLNRKMFVPECFKNDTFIDESYGVYIPHWSYSFEVEGDIVYQGVNEYKRDKVEVSDEYEVVTDVNGIIDNVTVDASQNFDDAIAYEIAPYKTDNAIPFHEGYAAGFFTDKETATEEEYEEIAKELAEDKIIEKVKENSKLTLTGTKKEPVFKRRSTSLTLLPVWFATFKNKNRVSYFVLNGQTGKMSMDLPVNKKSFRRFVFLLSVVMSLVLILLFNLILSSVNAISTSYLTMLLMLFSSYLLFEEGKTITAREKYLERVDKPKKKGQGFKGLVSSRKIIIYFGVILGMITLIFAMGNSDGGMVKPTLSVVLITLPIVVMQFLFLLKARKFTFKRVMLPMFITMFISMTGLFLYLIAIPNDFIYYILGMLNMIGIILNATGCVAGFDFLTSRPVPYFFRRGGGKQDAKN